MALKADDLFRMSWRGPYIPPAPTGRSSPKASAKGFYQQIAIDNGLDPRSLAFVYRPQKHDTAVVVAATGAFVADVIQMEYSYTEVSNTTQTKIVRQAFLHDEHRGQIGSAFGTESARYDSESNLLSDSFHGTFQYAIKDNDPYSDIPSWLEAFSPPYVFSGTFSTGARVRDLTGN